MIHTNHRKNSIKEAQRGSTLFIAVTIASLVVVIAMGIMNLTLRELKLSFLARESQAALSAADSGLECAMYWDHINEGNPTSLFATATPPLNPAPNINICGGQNLRFGPRLNAGDIGVAQLWSASANATAATSSFWVSTWSVDFNALDYHNPCAHVTVSKWIDSSGPQPVIRTRISSEGFNTCDALSIRRVSRGVRVTY